MLLKLILESKKIVADLITSSEEELMDTYKYGGKITYKGKDVTKEINEIIELTEHEIKVDLEENGTYNRGNTEYTETEVTHLENVYIGYNPDKDTLNLMFEVEWQEESEMYYDNDYDVDYDDDYDDYDAFKNFGIDAWIKREEIGQLSNLLNDIKDEISVLLPPKYNKFQNGFAHIFGGGYAAGYYSYKWAEVLSADAFYSVVDEDIFNSKTAQDYKNIILKNGGAKSMQKLFVDVMQREVDTTKLLILNGIK